ncbi:MAG: hypothetical protein AB1790_11625 [Pseudomonadota bacterium]
MAAEYGGDAQPHFPLAQQEAVPGGESLCLAETLVRQGAGGMAGGDDGQRPGQLRLRHAIPVIAVHLGQHAQIEGRQGFDLDGRIGQALGGDAVAQMGVIAGM